MTVPSPEQVISGHSHGEEVEFHDLSVSGLPHCCFKLRRIVSSVCGICEFTKRGR